MSSYDPPEDKDDTSSRDPGVQEKEIVDQRQFSAIFDRLDRVDYLVIGVLLAVPAGILTTILVLQFVPEYQETARQIVQSIIDFFSGNANPV